MGINESRSHRIKNIFDVELESGEFEVKGNDIYLKNGEYYGKILGRIDGKYGRYIVRKYPDCHLVGVPLKGFGKSEPTTTRSQRR